MNSSAENVMTQNLVVAQARPVAEVSTMQTLVWSVKRELWENRSIFIAPLSVAGLILLGIVASLLQHPEALRLLAGLDAYKQPAMVALPLSVAAMVIVVTTSVVGVFYCLDALYGERRDRSILFWKSLPVSDLTTVLAKASIPLVVLPVVTFVTVVALQLLMLLSASLLMLAHRLNAGILWRQLPLFQMEVVLAYGLVTLVLWHAPIYGWLLVVSSWAKRATLLWAILPLFAISVLEGAAFHTMHFALMLKYRINGAFPAAFDIPLHGGDAQHGFATMSLSQLAPGRFLGNPELWIGLVVAGMFFVAIVQLRRYRERI